MSAMVLISTYSNVDHVIDIDIRQGIDIDHGYVRCHDIDICHGIHIHHDIDIGRGEGVEKVVVVGGSGGRGG